MREAESAARGELSERVEREASNVVSEAIELLAALKRQLWRSECGCVSQQHAEHYEGLLKALESKREEVSIALCQQKARRLAKLAAESRVRQAKHLVLSDDEENNFEDAATNVRRRRPVKLYDDDAEAKDVAFGGLNSKAAAAAAALAEGAQKNTGSNAGVSDALTEEEQRMFAQENELIRNRMVGLAEKAEEIQRQLGELAQVMTRFSLEITQQKESMARIVDVTASSVVNVKKGNEALVEATSSSVDFRFFVLMFLIIMTLSLLFLHWYSA